MRACKELWRDCLLLAAAAELAALSHAAQATTGAPAGNSDSPPHSCAKRQYPYGGGQQGLVEEGAAVSDVGAMVNEPAFADKQFRYRYCSSRQIQVSAMLHVQTHSFVMQWRRSGNPEEICCAGGEDCGHGTRQRVAVETADERKTFLYDSTGLPWWFMYLWTSFLPTGKRVDEGTATPKRPYRWEADGGANAVADT